MSSSPQFHGLLLGAGQVVVTLLVFAFGLHSAPEMFEGANRFENIGAFVVMMATFALGLRALRKRRLAAGEGFGFAVGARATFVIASVGGLVNAAGQYVYVTAINPDFGRHLREVILRGANLPPEQAAAAQQQLDVVTSPLFRAVSQGGTTLFFGLFIGLAYAFLFRDLTPPAETKRDEAGV